MTNANDLVKGFTALFTWAGVPMLWAVFFVGLALRWLANARVKSQLGFLASFDRSLQNLKTTQAISQLQLREKMEGYYRTYFAQKGVRRMAFLDKLFSTEASSWQLVDRLVSSSFEKKNVTANERSRFLLSSIPSLTQFFNLFSLGAFHRIGAATPALLVLMGALGTYAGFLYALPILSTADVSDLAATNNAVQFALARLYTDTGFTILGTVLAMASVLINSAIDAERTFQSAVNRLAHVVEFLGNLEKTGNASEKVHRRVNEERAEEETVVTEAPKPAPAPAPEPAHARAAKAAAAAEEANPFNEASITEKPPRDRLRQRAQVVQAEQDWGPLPPSAVPSPRKKPIRVEAAEAPKLEEERSLTRQADDEVAATLRPEITEQSQAEITPPVQRRAPVEAPAPAPAPAAPIQAVETPVVPEAPANHGFGDLHMPETALPADWEEQIRGMTKPQAAAPAPVERAPEPAPLPENIQTPYDEILERTLTSIPAAKAAPEPAPLSDSPTEAELLAMMVPKEWASQRPADGMPHGMEDHEAPPEVPMETQPPVQEIPRPQTAAPAAPDTQLSSAEQDRLAILNHRLDKVSLYLRKAKEDLAEGIISQEMYDDESARWNVELETLGKEISALSTKRAA